jgi:alkylhydroperoxidase family enzyme
MKARKLGLDEQARQSVRRAAATGNARIDAITAIANEFFVNPGALRDDLVEQGRAAGLGDQEFVDIGLAVATIFFTNVVNHINDTQPTLPAAPSLQD